MTWRKSTRTGLSRRSARWWLRCWTSTGRKGSRDILAPQKISNILPRRYLRKVDKQLFKELKFGLLLHIFTFNRHI